MKRSKIVLSCSIILSGFLTVSSLGKPISSMAVVGPADAVDTVDCGISTGTDILDDETISAENDSSLCQVGFDVTYGQTQARRMLDMINDFRADSQQAWYWNETDTAKVYCNNLSDMENGYKWS